MRLHKTKARIGDFLTDNPKERRSPKPKFNAGDEVAFVAFRSFSDSQLVVRDGCIMRVDEWKIGETFYVVSFMNHLGDELSYRVREKLVFKTGTKACDYLLKRELATS